MARHTNPDGATVDTVECEGCGRPFASTRARAAHYRRCDAHAARNAELEEVLAKMAEEEALEFPADAELEVDARTAELLTPGADSWADPDEDDDGDDEAPLKACELSARRFALAWRAVFAAASDDAHRTELCDTVLLEQHDDRGIRLVATDTVAMLWAWVGYTEADQQAPPELDERPDRTLLVADYSGLPRTLFAHIIGSTKTKEGVDRLSPLRIRVGVFEERGNQPTLGSEVDRAGVILFYANEAVALPVVEVDFPTWRSVAQARPARGLKRVGFRPDYLRFMGGIRIDDAEAVELDLLGKAGIALRVPGDPIIHGRVMPVRLADADEAEEVDAA